MLPLTLTLHPSPFTLGPDEGLTEAGKCSPPIPSLYPPPYSLDLLHHSLIRWFIASTQGPGRGSDGARRVWPFTACGPYLRVTLKCPLSLISIDSPCIILPVLRPPTASRDFGGIDEGLSEPGECGIQSDYELSYRAWVAGWQVRRAMAQGSDYGA